jgi:hypothetical protein
VNDVCTKINGHRVRSLTRPAPHGSAGICIECGAQFRDRLEIEDVYCSNGAHGHELVSDFDSGLLYCRRCPLVAYDSADAATEPLCPMPLQHIGLFQ